MLLFAYNKVADLFIPFYATSQYVVEILFGIDFKKLSELSVIYLTIYYSVFIAEKFPLN